MHDLIKIFREEITPEAGAKLVTTTAGYGGETPMIYWVIWKKLEALGVTAVYEAGFRHPDGNPLLLEKTPYGSMSVRVDAPVPIVDPDGHEICLADVGKIIKSTTSIAIIDIDTVNLEGSGLLEQGDVSV